MSTSSLILLFLLTPWLVVLCRSDIRCRRLPNVWTLGGLVGAFAVRGGWAGWSGVADAAAAGGMCVLFLLLPFLVRAAGGGDVKMLAACGAFLGVERMFPFLISVSFAGFIVAVVLVVVRPATGARLMHGLRVLVDWRYDRAAGRTALPARTDEKGRVPFGVAIALGVWMTLLLEILP